MKSPGPHEKSHSALSGTQRPATSRRVVLSDDEDVPTHPRATASTPQLAHRQFNDSQRSFDTGEPHRAASASHSHPRPDAKSMNSAIMGHLGGQSRTVPAKRKDHSRASTSVSSLESVHDREVAPAHDADVRAAKRPRHTPPASDPPTIQAPTVEVRAVEMAATISPEVTTKVSEMVAVNVAVSLPYALPQDSSTDDRPPPPPPLAPFSRPRVPSTSSADSVPKRKKRALEFGPEGDRPRALDQAAPPPRSRAPSFDTTARPLEVPREASATPIEPRSPAVALPSNMAAVPPKAEAPEPAIPPPSPPPQPKRKVKSLSTILAESSSRSKPPDAASSDDAPSKSTPAPIPAPPPAPVLAKVEVSPSTVLTPSKDSPALAPPPPGRLDDTTLHSPPKRVKPLSPIDSISRPPKPPKPDTEKKHKRPRDDFEASSRSQQHASTSSKREARPEKMPGQSKGGGKGKSRAVIDDGEDEEPERPLKKKAKPHPQPEAKPDLALQTKVEQPKKKKLPPLASIIKESDQRKQSSNPTPLAPSAQIKAPPPPPAVPDPAAPAKSERADVHAMPTTPLIPGSSLVDESPRLVMAKKRADTELSIMHGAFAREPPSSSSRNPLDALFMLATAAAEEQTTMVKPRLERVASESGRESSMDSNRSARDRAQQQALSELMHTQDHPDLQNRSGPQPKRTLSAMLDDDNAGDAPFSPMHDILGLDQYGSSPEPMTQDEHAFTPPEKRAMSPYAQGQSRVETRNLSSPSAAGQKLADLPQTSSALTLATPGSPTSRRSPVPPAPLPSRKERRRRAVSSPEPYMDVEMDISRADRESARSANVLPPDDTVSSTIPRRRKTSPLDEERSEPQRKKQRPASPSPTPAPAAAASQEPNKSATEAPTATPAPAPKKKYGNFKKNKASADSKESEKEKDKSAPAPPPPTTAVSLPTKPATLPAKPQTAAPLPFGRQLPPEHSSRDLDPTSVLSSVLGRPKRDTTGGVTPEQRQEWDRRKAADRAQREKEYAEQGPPLRLQRQMQTILKWESKFKAKRLNIAPNIVAAAFKQRWESKHGQWVPGRRPQPESSRPPSGHHSSRPLPHPPRTNGHPPPEPPQSDSRWKTIGSAPAPSTSSSSR
ncbi:hypothetical protein EXIGLDRAFT_844256 [Exidia glandulosa HHB12029]|uniref:Uncharacterized protein n=1 Tax=Exidia glandulosa HHB12029 TaxID=1314781 RepID=A0A165C5E8_EXIGL|nr:hypothetical protein EXIGLDRAFT_844256 [Exidia glandulosa HHB12029]